MIDRASWLASRRAVVVATYDAEAATFDDEPYPATGHRALVDRLLATCPPDGLVLDAPCGTGRYFAQVRASGRRVVGIDQSPGMLAQAAATRLAERVALIGLQELAEVATFDAAMTIDAMENVPSEDWPLVLANLRRAVRPGGHLYLTVEEVDEAEIDAAYATAIAAGLPVIRGEVVDGDTAGYHYYPGRERVVHWFDGAALTVIEEQLQPEDGWSYRHWLVRTPAS